MLTVDSYETGNHMKDLNVCADSGRTLVLAWGGKWNINGWILVCGDPSCATEHSGITELPSHAMTVRTDKEAAVGVDAVMAAGHKDRMLPGAPGVADLERSIALIQVRFPKADLTHASAALFVMDCWRLSLDPLLGEIIPATFKVTEQGKPPVIVVVPIITEDGYLSLASRACHDRWAGPPRLMPISQAIMKEFPQHPDQWETMTKALTLSLCRDEKAWVWEARGRTGDMDKNIPWDQLNPSYGWMTHAEAESKSSTPAGTLPGNQARVRAVKRWVRENFAEARHNMIELTTELMQRAEGVTEALTIIEAEFVEIEPSSEQQVRAISPGKPTRQPAARAPRKTASPGEQPPGQNPSPPATEAATTGTAPPPQPDPAKQGATPGTAPAAEKPSGKGLTNTERLELWQRIIGGSFGMGVSEDNLIIAFKAAAPEVLRDKIKGPLGNDRVPSWGTNDLLIGMDRRITEAMKKGEAPTSTPDSTDTPPADAGATDEAQPDAEASPEDSAAAAFDALKGHDDASGAQSADQEAHDHEQSSGALGGVEGEEETKPGGHGDIPF